jgi:hypothetical protein
MRFSKNQVRSFEVVLVAVVVVFLEQLFLAAGFGEGGCVCCGAEFVVGRIVDVG